jgi:pyruvate dehydrogenase (quinone)
LYDAHKTLAPVLAIAAQIPSTEIGTDFFQETHPERLFLECSHYCQLVAIEKQIPRLLQIAMQTSLSRGGVSVFGRARRRRIGQDDLDTAGTPRFCP